MQICKFNEQFKVEKQADQSPVQGREVEKVIPGVRRSGLEDYIDNLVDKRSFFGKIKDFILPSQQSEIKHIEKQFERYQKVGIEIPKDILKKFDLEDDEFVFISEEQANQLKELGLEGEQKYQKALARTELEPYYGDFQSKDIASRVLDVLRCLPCELKVNNLNLLSTSTSMRGLINQTVRVVLAHDDILGITDLETFNKKLQFARDYNLKINLNFHLTILGGTSMKGVDFDKFIAFAENNFELVAHIEIMDLGCYITNERVAKLQKIFDQCISLIELKCHTLYDVDTLRFPETVTKLRNQKIEIGMGGLHTKWLLKQ